MPFYIKKGTEMKKQPEITEKTKKAFIHAHFQPLLLPSKTGKYILQAHDYMAFLTSAK